MELRTSQWEVRSAQLHLKLLTDRAALFPLFLWRGAITPAHGALKSIDLWNFCFIYIANLVATATASSSSAAALHEVSNA